MPTKIAILGDSHVPGRASRIPPRLMKSIREFNPERIVFTGDATTIEIQKDLRSIAHLDAVSGERDFLDLPEEVLFEVEGVKFGILHGNQVMPAGNLEELENLAVFLGVDVLISGHSHALVVQKVKKAVLINPGSSTGVSFPGEPATNPSAILLTASPASLSAKIVEIGPGGRTVERTLGLALLAGNSL